MAEIFTPYKRVPNYARRPRKIFSISRGAVVSLEHAFGLPLGMFGAFDCGVQGCNGGNVTDCNGPGVANMAAGQHVIKALHDT